MSYGLEQAFQIASPGSKVWYLDDTIRAPMEFIPADIFKHRLFRIPLETYDSYREYETGHTPNNRQGVIRDMTQVMAIMRYFDVPDKQLQERAMGYFDGTWSEQTQRILKDTKIPESVLLQGGYCRLGPDWCCPACDRSKAEVVRVSKSGTLTAKFVFHHDHTYDLIEAARFHPTFICEDCNALDAALKASINNKVKPRVLEFEETNHGVKSKTNVLTHFSFSPAEMRWIYGPREKNRIFVMSEEISKRARDVYEKHMEFGVRNFFTKVVKDWHSGNVAYRPDITKTPFLKKFEVSERVVDSAASRVVNGQCNPRHLVSNKNYEKYFPVLIDRATPISDQEAEAAFRAFQTDRGLEPLSQKTDDQKVEEWRQARIEARDHFLKQPLLEFEDNGQVSFKF